MYNKVTLTSNRGIHNVLLVEDPALDREPISLFATTQYFINIVVRDVFFSNKEVAFEPPLYSVLTGHIELVDQVEWASHVVWEVRELRPLTLLLGPMQTIVVRRHVLVHNCRVVAMILKPQVSQFPGGVAIIGQDIGAGEMP